MVELPDSVPIFRTNDAELAYKCSIKAGRYYNVSPYLIQTLLSLEGGVKGSKVRNSNGTYDYGPMQVNTIWIKEIKRIDNINVKESRLINDVCYNIHIGAFILSSKISEAGGDVWKGLGNYHSKTLRYHNRYLANARKIYKNIIKHWTETLGVVDNRGVIDRAVNEYSSPKKSVSGNSSKTISYSISP